jgi:segregation and condensation protein B
MAEEKTKEVLELQVPATLKSLIEALVFAAKEPLTIKQMRDIYEGEGPQAYLRQLDADEVEASINELNVEYERAEKPYRIVRIAGGFQFATMSSYADWIGRLYKEQSRRKLSQSGIESLAIIAYKQPVTKSDIELIRGVNCDYVLKTLLEKELVTVIGRAHAPGRPLLYGTTREFLKHFGLNEITDLPRPREIEEILGESQFETERRMLEAQAGADKMKDEEPEFKSRLPHIPKKKSDLDSTVEIKSRSNLRELKTVRRAESEAVFGADTPPKTLELTVELPVESPEIEPVADLNKDLTTPGLIVEPVADAIISQEDNVSANQDESAQDPVVNEVAAGPSQTKSLGIRPDLPDTSVQVGEPNSYTIPVHEPSLEEVSQEHPGALMDSQPAANKTKWQTWKEKVQGFIKKIFG